MSRRSLTPSEMPAPGLPPTRRQSGSRKEATDRVRFTVGGKQIEGWALNVSRGGLRAITDEPIDPGTKVELSIAEGPSRQARIVWVQEEPDGAIVGVEFLDVPAQARGEGGADRGSAPSLRSVKSGVHPPPVKKTPDEG